MDKAQFRSVKKSGNFPEPEMSSEIKQPLLRILEKRLSDYKTSITEDEAILERQEVSLRLRYAVMLRLSEKRILQKHIDYLKLFKVEDNNEGGSNKRRKLK
ncbi:9831_t:CDS:2 [Acaulospora morrowiae]|uniref:9831_t:CDS:1 n=1 Tax=Acaulospora morrowiae TaxID=94023 RepID=A0A9N8V5M8_9GLOM|nr:9831_t:CDS:2 [Acaulospora morrowiae]